MVTNPPAEPEVGPAQAAQAEIGQDLVRGGLWTVLGAVIGTPLAALTNVVVAQQLGVLELGRYAVIMTAWAIAASIINTGVSAASVQWMAQARGRGDTTEFSRVVRLCASYHLLLQAPLQALVALALLHEAAPGVQVFGAVAAGLTAVLGTASVVLTGTARNARAAQINIVVSVLTVTVTVAVAFHAHRATTLWAAVQSMGVIAGLCCLASMDAAARRALLRPTLSWRWPPGFRRYALNVGIGGLGSYLVFGRSELIVLDQFDFHEAAGLFAIAAGVAGLATVPLDALMAPLAPAAAFYTGISLDRARDILYRSIALASVLGGAIAATAPLIIGLLIPYVYGEGFRAAAWPAEVLTGLSLVQSVIGPFGAFALAAHRSGQLLVVSLGSAVVDVAVAVALVPFLGLKGAVLASVTGQAVHLLAAAEIAVRATQSARVELLKRSGPLVLGMGCGLAAVATSHVLSAGPIVDALLALASFAGFRIVLQLRPGMRIPPEEWSRLLGALGPKGQRLARLARLTLGTAN